MAKGSQPPGAGRREPEEVLAASVTVSARITAEQRESLKKRAEAAGLDLGPYLKRLILDDLDGRKDEATQPAAAAAPPTPAPTPPTAPPPPPASAPPSAPPRDLAALKASVDHLAGEVGRADPKAAIEQLRGDLGHVGKGVRAAVDQLRDEVGRRDPKTGIDLLRADMARTGNEVKDLRADVVTALRLVMLFVSRLPKGQQEKLTEEEVDKLLDQAFHGGFEGE